MVSAIQDFLRFAGLRYCAISLLTFVAAIAAESSTQLPFISLPAGQHVSLDIITSSSQVLNGRRLIYSL